MEQLELDWSAERTFCRTAETMGHERKWLGELQVDRTLSGRKSWKLVIAGSGCIVQGSRMEAVDHSGLASSCIEGSTAVSPSRSLRAQVASLFCASIPAGDLSPLPKSRGFGLPSICSNTRWELSALRDTISACRLKAYTVIPALSTPNLGILNAEQWSSAS